MENNNNEQKEPRYVQAEPLDFSYPHKGRAFCGLFLLIQCVLMFGHVVFPFGMLFFLPFLGLFPALILMFPAKDEKRLDAVLRGIAIAALYGVFIPYYIWFKGVAASDPQGAIAIFFTSPFAHAAWLLLASPWLVRRFLSHMWRADAR